MWITSEPLSAKDAEQSLRQAVKNLDDCIKRGQIEILDYCQWYTKWGKFDYDKVLQGWIEKHDQAVKRGFDGLRLSGNTFWLKEKDWREFTKYERTTNSVLGQYRMLAVCTYSLHKCGVSEVIDVIGNHQFTVIKQEGKWMLVESAERKKIWGVLQKKTHDLGERVKELNCLYSLSKLVEQPNISLEGIFQRIVNLIPLSWQYPEITCARVAFEDKEFITDNFKITKWKQSADIKVHKTNTGTVEVYYLQEKPESHEGTFLKEERDLIETLAERLGRIVERKKAEELLRLHSEITVNMSEGVYVIRVSDGVIVYANPKFEEIFGYDPGEMVGKHVSIVNAPTEKSPEETAKEIMAIINKEGKWQGEIKNVKKDGTPFWCYASVSGFDHPEHGRLQVVVHTDITEQKKAEEKIQNLAKFPSENPNSVLRITKDGKVLYSNEAGKPLLAKWKSKVGGIIPKKWHNLITEALTLEKGKTKVVEEEVKGKFFSLTIAPVKDAGYVNLYANDITERKKLEEQTRKRQAELFHISRLSTVGEMASGLAHELNQPLCAILTHSNVCLRTIKPGMTDIDQITKNLKTIESQTQLAGEIIRRIKNLVQKRQPHQTSIDINAIICEVVCLMTSDLQHNNIKLDLQLDEQIPMVLADAVQIEQVLINLIRNAIESMERIKTRERRLTIQTSINANNAIEATVCDTGEGLPPRANKKLFDSFFTTKPDGLGIGLAICRSIIEIHKGELWAKPNPDCGSTFRFTLPIVEGNP